MTRFARPIAVLAVAVVASVMAERLALRLPGVPYNVSELFLDNASVTALTFFALALLWIGAGAMLVADAVERSRRPYVMLPVMLVVVAMVSKMLVSRGVTYESLDDVLGSNNLFGLVTTQNIWGAWWRDHVLALGVDTIDFLERRVRYCALYSIPVLSSALAFGVISGRDHRSRRRATSDFVALVIVILAWFSLCGLIVLSWAATDNLTELIATVGPVGIPGPLFLLATTILAAANAAVVLNGVRSAGRASLALIASAAAVPASWSLLNAGLEQHVQKYGIVFSATQLLLGPDRQHTLTTTVLFARWAALYLGWIVCLAAGGWLATAFRDAVVRTLTVSRQPAAVPEAS